MSTEKDKLAVSGLILQTFFFVRVAAQIPIRLIVTKIQEIQRHLGLGEA